MFHLFEIHVLSEWSFPTIKTFSFRMHIDSGISLFTCSRNSWISFRNKSLISFFLVWILKFKKKTLSLVYAKSDYFVNTSFGSWGYKLYLFHLFGILVLSELSFPLFPLISPRMHCDHEISVLLVREISYILFFEIKSHLIIFPLFGILKFTKKPLWLISPTSYVLSSLSARGVLNLIFFFFFYLSILDIYLTKTLFRLFLLQAMC